jgi:Tol biopolymer transport system component
MSPHFVQKSFFMIFVILFLFSPSLPAKDSQVLSALDTLRINQVSNPHLSPDGQWVVFTLTTRDMQDEDYKSTTHIWKVKVDGAEKRQMTQGENNCTSPSWFPDGKTFAFLSSRGKVRIEEEDEEKESRSQIFVMHIDGEKRGS